MTIIIGGGQRGQRGLKPDEVSQISRDSRRPDKGHSNDMYNIFKNNVFNCLLIVSIDRDGEKIECDY